MSFEEISVRWFIFLQDMTGTGFNHRKRGLIFTSCHRDLCSFNCCRVSLGTGYAEHTLPMKFIKPEKISTPLKMVSTCGKCPDVLTRS